MAYFSRPSNALISCSRSRIVSDCMYKMFCSLPDGTPLDIDDRCRLCADPSNLDLDGLEGSAGFASTPFSTLNGTSAMSNPNALWEMSERHMRLLNSRAAASLPVTVETISNSVQCLNIREHTVKSSVRVRTEATNLSPLTVDISEPFKAANDLFIVVGDIRPNVILLDPR